MSKGIRDVVEKHFYYEDQQYIGDGIPPQMVNNSDQIDQALSDISVLIREAIDQCLVWNDSDTHIIVKDLREALKAKGVEI